MTKFETTLEPPYETNGSVMPVSGTRRRTPPTMMNVCSAKPNVSPAARSFENPSWAMSATRIPRATTREEEEEHGGGADQPELLGDRGVDEVGLEVRDQRRPVDRLERPAADARAAVAAVRDRVEALDELVRVAVLPVLEPRR